MKKVWIITLSLIVTFILLTLGLHCPVFATSITSLTLEKSTNSGAWTNAPGGIWSTNLGDPLTQLGVMQNGSFLNNPVPGGLELGEISIELQPGINTFNLYGNAVYGGHDFLGLALFFDNISTPPQSAVYNSSGGDINAFSITPVGTTISGSANGGLFPDVAPGTAIYTAIDGSTVEVVGFTASLSGDDLVSWGNIESDGIFDIHGQLSLNYNPVPEPATCLLLIFGFIGMLGVKKKFS